MPLDQADTQATLRRHSPSGFVPVLQHQGLVVWDSLAIGEYLAEICPQAGLWPEARAARAFARSMVAEMHSGFQALRQELPMDLRRRRLVSPSAKAQDAIARVLSLWEEARASFGTGGLFLFGERPCLTDCYYAPVVGRFVTYGVVLPGNAQSYVHTITSWAPYRSWYEAAVAEPWDLGEHQ